MRNDSAGPGADILPGRPGRRRARRRCGRAPRRRPRRVLRRPRGRCTRDRGRIGPAITGRAPHRSAPAPLDCDAIGPVAHRLGDCGPHGCAAAYRSAPVRAGSRAVSTAAACSASRVCTPASATTSPLASVTAAGRSTSMGPIGSSSAVSRSAVMTSTWRRSTVRAAISASRSRTSAPPDCSAWSSGSRSSRRRRRVGADGHRDDAPARPARR